MKLTMVSFLRVLWLTLASFTSNGSPFWCVILLQTICWLAFPVSSAYVSSKLRVQSHAICISSLFSMLIYYLTSSVTRSLIVFIVIFITKWTIWSIDFKRMNAHNIFENLLGLSTALTCVVVHINLTIRTLVLCNSALSKWLSEKTRL